jgi:hypothetical protein
MKLHLSIALAAAAAGFLGGWLAKPAPAAAPITAQATNTHPVPAPVAVNPPPSPVEPPPEPASPPPGRPPQVVRPDLPAVAESVDAAKLQRLVELLGLDEKAQAELRRILDETAKAFAGGDPTKPLSAKDTLDRLAAATTSLEQSLKALLTPEQATLFAALRQRERDNRIEAKAQRELSRLCEITDLSPAQREQILAKLRETTAGELGSLPPAYSLMVEPSVLPLGPHALPEQSILTLTQLAEVDTATDHNAAHAKLIEGQRQRLEEQLSYLRGILTPAQLAQYQAAAAGQRTLQELLRPHSTR